MKNVEPKRWIGRNSFPEKRGSSNWQGYLASPSSYAPHTEKLRRVGGKKRRERKRKRDGKLVSGRNLFRAFVEMGRG